MVVPENKNDLQSVLNSGAELIKTVEQLQQEWRDGGSDPSHSRQAPTIDVPLAGLWYWIHHGRSGPSPSVAENAFLRIDQF